MAAGRPFRAEVWIDAEGSKVADHVRLFVCQQGQDGFARRAISKNGTENEGGKNGRLK
jgi:hypothetical protein